ncbi:ATP-binding protein [Accumulibacter sp.]|uniref:ATP-binding protein n=1 Tax=Accumulibacter sp. TaxID=2053492 RepID=UPI0028C4416B|nr:ATP-binding protein [Accumulibacter sp.]
MDDELTDQANAIGANRRSLLPVSPELLRALRSIVVAEIDVSGKVISANDGFFLLLQHSPDGVLDHVGAHLINPDFAELVARMQRVAVGGPVYRGLITFVDDRGVSRSLPSTVFRHGDHLGLVAEHDVREHERSLDVVMRLNDELAEQQRALSRANRLLAREKAEQQRLLAELENAQSQLVQSAKLASLGQLAAGVAHEINNPLGFVGSNLSVLGNYVQDLLAVVDTYAASEALIASDASALARIRAVRARCDIDFVRDDAATLVSEASAGVARVARIVRDLKDFSRINESQWQVADLHACLDSTLNVASHELGRVADVTREYGALPEVHCCPGELNQAFMNLLVNAGQAVDASGKGRGQIFVRTGCQGDEGWIEIEDTGHGIAPENLQRIFDPFFTTRPVGAGTGLGLSSAWGIVESHGGRIEVRSEPGIGSRFRIWLPLSRKGLG